MRHGVLIVVTALLCAASAACSPASGDGERPPEAGFRGDARSLVVLDPSKPAPEGSRWDAGVLRVDADDFVLENVFVRAGIDYYGHGALTIRASVVEADADARTAVYGRGGRVEVRDTTLRWKGEPPPGEHWGEGAISSTGPLTAVGNDLSGTPDGIDIAGSGNLIEGNYIHDLALKGQYPDNTHNDGIQDSGGTGTVIRHNWIDISANGMATDGQHQNAAVFIQPLGTPSVKPEIIGNFLSGGGFILHLEGPISDGVVRDNRFGSFTPGGWGNVDVRGDVTFAEWAGNKDSTGKPVERP